MPYVLDMEIRMMHKALANISTEDLSDVQIRLGEHYCSVDFNEGSDEIKLANDARLLVNNIASLKDHLKVWCHDHGVSFGGDELIDNDFNVGLVHDLWNVQKHRKLNSAPRSGVVPEIRNYMTVLHFGRSKKEAFLHLDPATGQMDSQGGEIVLFAEIFDQDGKKVGLFHQICREAVQSWHQELKTAGVNVPTS